MSSLNLKPRIDLTTVRRMERLTTTTWSRTAAAAAHLPVADRAAGLSTDVGERPQRRHPPRSARLRADARGGDASAA
jgi:hypothetical protein